MKDYYGDHLLTGKIWKLLEKERSAGIIAKKTKIPLLTIYRILKSLDKHNRVTTRDTSEGKDNKPLKLYKLKTIRRQS